MLSRLPAITKVIPVLLNRFRGLTSIGVVSRKSLSLRTMSADTSKGSAAAFEEVVKLLEKHSDLRPTIAQWLANHPVTANPVKESVTDASALITTEGGSGKKRKRGVFDMRGYRYRHIALHFLYLGEFYHGFASQEQPSLGSKGKPSTAFAVAEGGDGHSEGLRPAKKCRLSSSDTKPHSAKSIEQSPLLTIESALFTALQKACLIESRESCGYTRCGRTDRGVSAAGQVVSLRIRSKAKRHDSATEGGSTSISTDGWSRVDGLTNSGDPYPLPADEIDYVYTLNSLLPDDIRVLGWCDVNDDFSARFSATLRTYRYFFVRRHLDLGAMESAAKKLVGVHDFRNFCKFDIANTQNFVREVVSARIVPCASSESVRHALPLHPTNHLPVEISALAPHDLMYVEVVGRAFLWHQIRCIVALLFHIGRGYEPVDVIDKLLDVEAVPARPQYPLAEELPLCLFHCSFGEDEEPGTATVVQDGDAAEGGDTTVSAAGDRPSRFKPDPTLYSRMFVTPRALAKVAQSLEDQWARLSIKRELLRAMLHRVYAIPVASEVDGELIPLKQAMVNSEHELSNCEYQIVGALPETPSATTGVQVPDLLRSKAVYTPLLKRPTGLSLQERWNRVPASEKAAILAQHPVNAPRMLQQFQDRSSSPDTASAAPCEP